MKEQKWKDKCFFLVWESNQNSCDSHKHTHTHTHTHTHRHTHTYIVYVSIIYVNTRNYTLHNTLNTLHYTLQTRQVSQDFVGPRTAGLFTHGKDEYFWVCFCLFDIVNIKILSLNISQIRKVPHLKGCYLYT